MSHDPFHDLFERAAPPASTAARTRTVLDDVRPGFVRARRHHRLRIAAAAVTTSVLLAGGAAALVTLGENADPIEPLRPATSTIDDRVSTDDDQVPTPTVDDPPVPDADGTATDPVTVAPDPSDAPAGDPATSTRPNDDPADTSEPEGADPDEDPTEPDGADHDDDPAEPDGADHAEGDEDDNEASTTTVATGEPTIASTAGGSVSVTFDGSVITIRSIDPVPGFSAEVKESDPTEVRVDFRNGVEEYEVEIQVEAGELRVDTEGPDDS